MKQGACMKFVFWLTISSFCCGVIESYKLEERYGGLVLEGDMLVQPHDIREVIKEGDLMPKQDTISSKIDLPQVGKSTAKLHYRWDEGVVPYVINSDLSCFGSGIFGKSLCFLGGGIKAIEKAIEEWEAKTCIKFVKRTNERDYVEFVSEKFGQCYSNVGRIGGRQVIALGKFCRKPGIVMHEIAHALGMFHEQSRTDRDEYVTIEWDHIKKGNEINFKKYLRSELADQNMPYDYASIMHYEDDAFAKWPWQRTVIPKKSGVKIGQRDHLSAGDVEEIKKYYQCAN